MHFTKNKLTEEKKDYGFINQGKDSFLCIKKFQKPFLTHSDADRNTIIEKTGESVRRNFLVVEAILDSSLIHHSFTLRIVVKLVHIE